MKFTLEHALILILAISVIYSVIQYSTSRVSFNTKVVKAKHSTTENPCSILNSPLIGQDCTVFYKYNKGMSLGYINRCPNDDGSLICFPGDEKCHVNSNLADNLADKCEYNHVTKTYQPKSDDTDAPLTPG